MSALSSLGVSPTRAATLPTMEGSDVRGRPRQEDLLLRHVTGQDRAVAIHDLTAWGRHADDPDLIAGDRRRIGLAVDDLQRPEPQDEDEEERDDDAADHPESDVGPGGLVLRRPHQRGHVDALAGAHAGLTGLGPPRRKAGQAGRWFGVKVIAADGMTQRALHFCPAEGLGIARASPAMANSLSVPLVLVSVGTGPAHELGQSLHPVPQLNVVVAVRGPAQRRLALRDEHPDAHRDQGDDEGAEDPKCRCHARADRESRPRCLGRRDPEL